MKTIQTVKSMAFGLLAVGVTMGANSAIAQEQSLESLEERAGYTIGVNIGMGLEAQGFQEDISIDALVAGLRDVLGGDLQLSQEDMMVAIQEFTDIQETKMAARMEAETAAQRDFLAENGQKEGVVTTDSGLQYMVIEEGPDAGAPSPTTEDTVNVHYHGMLIDGTVFDSSMERNEPITFPVTGVIPGWTEGLQLMQVGDVYRFFIPSDLAYGPSGAGDVIPPNATLVFDVELLGIE